MQKRYKVGESESCRSLVCDNPVETHPKALHPRRFCSNHCKLDTWAFRRVAAMLLPLGQSQAWEILQSMGNGDTEDKARGEIVLGQNRVKFDE